MYNLTPLVIKKTACKYSGMYDYFKMAYKNNADQDVAILIILEGSKSAGQVT